MNNKILSLNDIEEISKQLAYMNGSFVEFQTQFDSAIKALENETVVQSFYESGNFGATQKERIFELKQAIDEYEKYVRSPGGLISKTNEFLNEQRDLLTKNAYGYTYSDSIRARREGNKQ